VNENVKIIIAIADPKLQEIIVWLLKAWGYNALTISQDAGDTLEYLKKESADLIIIDAAFQDNKGLAICKDIKNDFLIAYTPTIILIDKKQLRRDLLSIEEGVDDYLIKPPDPIDLEIRIALALRSAAHHFNANALTKLPGNKLIKKELMERISKREPFSFQYIDIDNFKAYNDKYGYMRGDDVLIETSKMISKNVKSEQNSGDFVGHIGGDDFVAITQPQNAEKIAKTIIQDFDSGIGAFYSQADRSNGYLISQDRAGKSRHIPLMSLSIAIVNNIASTFLNLLEISDIATEIKSHLKELPGSNFMVNRRFYDKGIAGRKNKRIRKEE